MEKYGVRAMVAEPRLATNNIFTTVVVSLPGGTRSELPESTPAGFCVFLSDPESKIFEKPDPDPASLFNFDSSRSLCSHFLNKNMGKLQLDR